MAQKTTPTAGPTPPNASQHLDYTHCWSSTNASQHIDYTHCWSSTNTTQRLPAPRLHPLLVLHQHHPPQSSPSH
ncbi:unnamed protein product [Gadus morhua 'NCC']